MFPAGHYSEQMGEHLAMLGAAMRFLRSHLLTHHWTTAEIYRFASAMRGRRVQRDECVSFPPRHCRRHPFVVCGGGGGGGSAIGPSIDLASRALAPPAVSPMPSVVSRREASSSAETPLRCGPSTRKRNLHHHHHPRNSPPTTTCSAFAVASHLVSSPRAPPSAAVSRDRWRNRTTTKTTNKPK